MQFIKSYSTSSFRLQTKEYLYVIQSTNLDGLAIYTKGKLVFPQIQNEPRGETYYFLVSFEKIFLIKYAKHHNVPKRVRKAWNGTALGQAYIVPNLIYHHCGDCGEQVFDREAMRRIEAVSPAYQKPQRRSA